ncbi:hypothetical protein ACFL6I_22495, partial [candidate division KSB1 bacterium]
PDKKRIALVGGENFTHEGYCAGGVYVHEIGTSRPKKVYTFQKSSENPVMGAAFEVSWPDDSTIEVFVDRLIINNRAYRIKLKPDNTAKEVKKIK